MDYVAISPRQASRLAGCQWTMDGTYYFFGDRMRAGGEAFVYPLLGADKKTVAYVRFLQEKFASPARVERTDWFIRRNWPSVSSVFMGAPYAWASTFEYGRPAEFEHDFTATLHKAVPGESWASIKASAFRRKRPLPTARTRRAVARSMIAQFATIESLCITQGDPSDGNLIVDLANGEARLIDFDTFVFRSRDLRFPALSVAEGGAKGTPGYMPPDLEQSTSREVAPYSDRFGRDMLLLELLGLQPGDPPDASPARWIHQKILLDSARPLAERLGLPHLLDMSVFSLPEEQRPSSNDLAIAVDCQWPEVNWPMPNRTWREWFIEVLKRLEPPIQN